MLKLVFIAAVLAAVASNPLYPSYLGSTYYDRPEQHLNPFGLSGGYGYAAPVQYFRGAIPNPYSAPVPYNPFQSMAPYMSAPVVPTYFSPEQYPMYEAAIASLNPLAYAAKQEAMKQLPAQPQASKTGK